MLKENYRINMEIALTKLSPTNRVLKGETLNRFGDDHDVLEKRGAYYLYEENNIVTVIYETVLQNPITRSVSVEVFSGEIISLTGFYNDLTDMEKKEKAAELFMGFATCRRFFEISNK